MNEIDANIIALQQDQIKMAGTFHRLFKSTDGATVLALLKSETDRSALSGNILMDGDSNVNPAEFMFIREGQNSVVRFIDKMLKYYEGNK